MHNGEERHTSAELLHEHGEPTRLRRPPVAPDREELLQQVPSLSLLGLDLEQLVSVEHVPGSLDFCIPKATHGLEGLVVLALLHVPTGRLRAQIHLNHNNQRRNRSRGQHPAPLAVLAQEVRVLESNGCDKPEHDAESRPHLPHHREGWGNTLAGLGK